MAKGRSTVRYSVHPGVEMMRKLTRELPETTGRTLAEWMTFIAKKGPAGERELQQWLAKEHGVARYTAKWLAQRSLGKDTWDEDPDAYLARAEVFVREMYAGKRAALRVIHDRVLEKAVILGKDVKVCPCQTIVPLYRKFVFAELNPSTNTRLDLRLALGEQKPKGRLEAHRATAGERLTHRIRLSSPDDVDAEVLDWLRLAYEQGNETAKKKPAGKAPADLATALGGSTRAKATWDALTDRMRGDWIAHVTEAKKAETRAKRIDRAIERLAAGKKGVY